MTETPSAVNARPKARASALRALADSLAAASNLDEIVAAVQAERYPAYVQLIETVAGVLLIGGLGLIGAALPIAA